MRRRFVFPVVVVLAVVAAAAVAALAGAGTGSGDLDPDSGAPGGSRAVARILGRQGVQVDRVRDPADAQRESGTVVIVHPELVPPAQLGAVRSRALRLVLVAPDATALDAVGEPEVRPEGGATAGTVDPQCSSTAAVGPARAGGSLYSVLATTPSTVCYPDRPGTGSLVELASGLVVLGQPDVLRNAYLDQDANAALALRLLGTADRLTWLVPDPLAPTAAAPSSLTDVLPAGVRWVAAQLAVVVVLIMLWRGRRLGPLVPERLPVAVRSTETLLGRARLYRRARARGRAAATLRTATLRRLAARLAVGPEAGPDAVAVRVAQATGAQVGDVRRVLLGPPPPDERALVMLADELDALERNTRETDR